MNTFIRRGVLAAATIALSGGMIAFVLKVHAENAPVSQWNQSKATYLAQRVLLDPTPADVAKLTNAGSAEKAVEVLFTVPSPAETQAYQTALVALSTQLKKTETKKNAVANRNTIYTYKLIHNPNDVQQKLYYLWENTFSVDSQGADEGDVFDRISDQDVNTLDQILYDNAYGNYPSIVQRVQTTYAMSKYLNLVNASKGNPNENYSREMMQLFLMGQYSPLDPKMEHENYSDADVNALAYLLTGYRRTGGDITAASTRAAVIQSGYSKNSIYFSPKQHYSRGPKLFFGNMVNFPDPINTIPYIVTQRRTQISEFLANKILNYYVSDNPTPEDVTAFANILSVNDFNVLPSLKWLFASPLMYRSQYMQEERYKSPPELVASLYTSLYGRNNYAIIPDATILTDIGFSPMLPGSIFGRPGFGKNSLFFSGTILDKWIGDTDRLMRAPAASAQLQQFLASTISQNAIATPQQLVRNFENTLYLGKVLPQKVEQDLATYISTASGTASGSALSTKDPVSVGKMIGMLDLMVGQPEFILNSGSPSVVALPQPLKATPQTASSTLIIVRLHGGLDYQQIVANVKDPAYATNRQALNFSSKSTPIGNGYILNNIISSLLPLINSKQAFFVTGIGLPGQVRAHDIASTQMETGLNLNHMGILGGLQKAVPTLDMVSITNAPPILYGGGASIQMGTSNLSLFPELAADNASASGQLQTFKTILQDRSLPKESALYYSQLGLLNQLGEENVAQGGKGTPGYRNVTQFPFVKGLITKHVGNVYYLYADGGYDYHYDETTDFNDRVSTLMKQLVSFYNDESPTTKLTIVVFSEFGRTDQINGNYGTDHGIGGGMIVLSNVLHWPTMIGTLTPSTDLHNWSDVVVDERDVWSTIFNSLYGVPVPTLFGRTQTVNSYPVTIQ